MRQNQILGFLDKTDVEIWGITTDTASEPLTLKEITQEILKAHSNRRKATLFAHLLISQCIEK